MGFWNTGNAQKDPKRNFRFKIQFEGLTDDTTSIVWYAKKVGKPNFSVTESKHSFLNHTFYWPGRVEWQAITMTLVDPISPNAVNRINEMIENAGYKIPGGVDGSFETMSKQKAAGANGTGTVVIMQIDSNDVVLEKWTLHAPWIKSVKYGDLDYENDELTEIELEIRYDWAKCDTTGAAGSKKFETTT